MKLKEFKFNSITVRGLAIYIDDKEVASGYIGEVLRQISYLKDYNIKETNYYFDEFVIRLEGII